MSPGVEETAVTTAQAHARAEARAQGLIEDAESHVDRARMLASRVVERVGGLAAVRVLVAVFATYDIAGGGLSAAGLAYSALFALVPGLLLVLSVVGLIVEDPAVREQIVEMIAVAVPPIEDFARAAFEQVAAGAVPTGIVAVIGLLWGSSRFYSSLDYAFSRVFHTARRRNEIERGVRGLLVSAVFVALPIALVILGSVLSWLMEVAPGWTEVDGLLQAIVQLGSPIIMALLYIGAVAVVYRYMPTVSVPLRALGLPALGTGLVLAVFTQLFAFIAPRMVGWAALFGALVTVFALLIWMSISLNVLLMGACWTKVRLSGIEPGMLPVGPDGVGAGEASS